MYKVRYGTRQAFGSEALRKPDFKITSLNGYTLQATNAGLTVQEAYFLLSLTTTTRTSNSKKKLYYQKDIGYQEPERYSTYAL